MGMAALHNFSLIDDARSIELADWIKFYTKIIVIVIHETFAPLLFECFFAQYLAIDFGSFRPLSLFYKRE
jgi:hypothetical protein